MAISATPRLIFRIVSMLALLAVGCVNGATHRHSAPAPAPSAAAYCSALIMDMADCLTYVSSGSSVTKPEGTCCAGLKTVLRTRAECLCEGLKSSSQMGIVLNVTKAATLPAACSLSAPSVSNCGLGAPTGMPGLVPDHIAPTQGNSAADSISAALVSLLSGFVFLGLIVSAV
uniref:Bifunctional inhibitor/plant lipid transfer protein/seed storage helical domain-containing protein n=1 Tax=Kalanchoe fedtschenkoi TaxID=63787 RepID=A0A7N0VFM4_KALFE